MLNTIQRGARRFAPIFGAGIFFSGMLLIASPRRAAAKCYDDCVDRCDQAIESNKADSAQTTNACNHQCAMTCTDYSGNYFEDCVQPCEVRCQEDHVTRLEAACKPSCQNQCGEKSEESPQGESNEAPSGGAQ